MNKNKQESIHTVEYYVAMKKDATELDTLMHKEETFSKEHKQMAKKKKTTLKMFNITNH